MEVGASTERAVATAASDGGDHMGNDEAVDAVEEGGSSWVYQLAVIGGGHIARMMALESKRIGVRCVVLDPMRQCPAGQIAEHQIEDSVHSLAKLGELASGSDAVTTELDFTGTANLRALQEEAPELQIHPTPSCLDLLQDRYALKAWLSQHGITTMEARLISNESDPVTFALDTITQWGLPIICKARQSRVDPHGGSASQSEVINTKDDISAAIKAASNGGSVFDVFLERWCRYQKELLVLVVKTRGNQCISYDAVENIRKKDCDQVVIAPAQIPDDLRERARTIAEAAVSRFSGAGVFGVELFIVDESNIVVNAIIPRPHDAGHYTMEACVTSQFENHVRACLGISVGDTAMKVGAAVTVSVLGAGKGDIMSRAWSKCDGGFRHGSASVHWYSKSKALAGRRMGHVTIVGPAMASLLDEVQEQFLTPAGLPPRGDHLTLTPIVSIVMGSDSDLAVMKKAAEVMVEFKIPFEVDIVSPHRTPGRMYNYARSAHLRGIKVVIAGSGGVAHLPGMLAALTPLPVIGVPIADKPLDGTDSLHSIVQMPQGVPVACVGIDSAHNAGLLAIRMLGSHNGKTQEDMVKFQASIGDDTITKVKTLSSAGWKNYVE